MSLCETMIVATRSRPGFWFWSCRCGDFQARASSRSAAEDLARWHRNAIPERSGGVLDGVVAMLQDAGLV